MTARCAGFVRLISLRLDGVLEGAHAGQLEEHLAACAACRARELSLLAQGESIRVVAAGRLAALEASGEIDLSNFAERVLRAARRDAQRPSRWTHVKLALRERWEHQRLALSAALGVAMAGAAALAILFAAPHPRPPAERELLAQESPSPQNAPVAQASIDALELLSGTDGAVFEVPGQTTVIWLSDEAVE
jgi:anti-sigma factor RsiW